ncbi:hypothetical protein JTB14_024536 [Gonioctena quinquepunctata]|nr:hypothetical protein JTB14_024536 [Gonioctena quinquepunctata]
MSMRRVPLWLEQQAEESATEQENTSDESEGEKETMEEFSNGKNKSTQWRKTTYRVSGKTKGINLVKVLTGLTQKALGIENELNAFFHIIDKSMIVDVLKYTNMYIDQLRVVKTSTGHNENTIVSLYERSSQNMPANKINRHKTDKRSSVMPKKSSMSTLEEDI